jgi:hypothetical protein
MCPSNMTSHTPIKALAGFMGVYHLVMGVLGIWSGATAARAAQVLWHAQVTVDPQFSYLAKFLGAYVIAFGVMLLFVARDPVRYGPLVYVAALLGAIRIAERLIFANELKEAFGIGLDRTIVTAVIVLALNGGLILLKPREQARPGST